MLRTNKSINLFGVALSLLGIGFLVIDAIADGFNYTNIGTLSALIVLGLGFAAGIFTKGNKE